MSRGEIDSVALPSVCRGGEVCVFAGIVCTDITPTVSGCPEVVDTWRSTDGFLEASVGKYRDGLTTDMMGVSFECTEG